MIRKEQTPDYRPRPPYQAIIVKTSRIRLQSELYELSGKSRGASTAKRTVEGAAVGSIIGAIAGGDEGAAIGARGAAGAGSEIITKGDQVKVPSETLLELQTTAERVYTGSAEVSEHPRERVNNVLAIPFALFDQALFE